MRIKILLITTATLLSVSTSLFCDDQKQVTGKDWLLMTSEEKSVQITSDMEKLQKQGVVLEKAPEEYIAKVDSFLIDSPEFTKANMTMVLAVAARKEMGNVSSLEPRSSSGNLAGKPKSLGDETKKWMQEHGYHADVVQSGNLISIGPKHYEKGKAPISTLERKIYDEYTKELETTKDASGGYDDNKKNLLVQNIINKYKMSLEDFSYLVLKVAYDEVTPDSYRAPTETQVNTL